MTLNIILLFFLVTAGFWTVMTRSLLRAAIGLALTSVILTIIMFKLNSPLAAVFELSVCAGLISVLFVSTISLTHPLSKQDKLKHMRDRLARFWFLPLILIALAVVFGLAHLKPFMKLPEPEAIKDVRFMLWNQRRIDMLGQIAILLTGVFGVVILFKERVKK